MTFGSALPRPNRNTCARENAPPAAFNSNNELRSGAKYFAGAEWRRVCLRAATRSIRLRARHVSKRAVVAPRQVHEFDAKNWRAGCGLDGAIAPFRPADHGPDSCAIRRAPLRCLRAPGSTGNGECGSGENGERRPLLRPPRARRYPAGREADHTLPGARALRHLGRAGGSTPTTLRPPGSLVRPGA